MAELRKFGKNQRGVLKIKKWLFVKEKYQQKVRAFGKVVINLLALRSYFAGHHFKEWVGLYEFIRQKATFKLSTPPFDFSSIVDRSIEKVMIKRRPRDYLHAYAYSQTITYFLSHFFANLFSICPRLELATF